MSPDDSDQTAAKASAVSRRPLLTAVLGDARSVERVETHEIKLPPNQKTGLHTHPCPVVGTVTHGSILFQIEGRPSQRLEAGDVFFEPADTRIAHFDAQEQGATFLACYLMSPGEHEFIIMLD